MNDSDLEFYEDSADHKTDDSATAYNSDWKLEDKEFDDVLSDVDLTDEGYDYDADRLLYVPDWTKESPHLFRASVTPVEQDNLADVVPFDQLNRGQQQVVTYLMTKARAVFGRDHVDGNPDPFSPRDTWRGALLRC